MFKRFSPQRIAGMLTSEDVPDGSVRRPPHLLQVELLHSCLVRGDGGTLDTHVVLLDGVSSVHRNCGETFSTGIEVTC